MSSAPEFPEVVITSPVSANGPNPVPARLVNIVVGGHDLTNWVTDFRVGGGVKGAIELDLKLLVSSVRWEGAEAAKKPVVEVQIDQDRLDQLIRDQVAKHDQKLREAINAQRS